MKGAKTLLVGVTPEAQALGEAIAGKVIRASQLLDKTFDPALQFRLAVVPILEGLYERKHELREQACAFYLRAVPNNNALWTYLGFVELRPNGKWRKKVYVGGDGGGMFLYEFSWLQPALPTPDEILRKITEIIRVVTLKKFERLLTGGRN